MDLREVLSSDEIARYEEYFFYIDQDAIERRKNDTNLVLDDSVKSLEEKSSELEARRYPDEMGHPIPVGIFVNESAFIEATEAYPRFAPVYGISVSSQRVEAAVKYLEFLWEYNHAVSTNL
jgi:hypothetical protein